MVGKVVTASNFMGRDRNNRMHRRRTRGLRTYWHPRCDAVMRVVMPIRTKFL